ncbi:MAG: hypothetical protein ACP5D9_15360 [Mariniphaga sp.]
MSQLTKTIIGLIFFIILKINSVVYSQEFAPDTAIVGVNLLDAGSVIMHYGDKLWEKLIEDDEMYKVIALNNKKNQKLELIVHHGANKNEFSEFKISHFYNKIQKCDHVIVLHDIDSFITQKGIKLGISRLALEDKLKMKNLKEEINQKGELVLSFSKELNDSFLGRYNMPEYYGIYTFKNNKLIEFSFGFIVP